MTNWQEIEQARAKAHAKHGENSIEGITADDPRWLSILVEEGGEASEATLLAWNALLQARIGRVAHEQTYDATGSLRAELVDVLAVGSAWLDALDAKRCSSLGPWESDQEPERCILNADHTGLHVVIRDGHVMRAWTGHA